MDTKAVAFVLGGGSIKGAFQAGAIGEALAQGFVPSGLYGVSVGSLNAAFLADRAGRDLVSRGAIHWPRIGAELIDFWLREITSFARIGKTRRRAGLLFKLIFRKFSGLIDTHPIADLIRETISEEDLRHCPVPLRVGSVNLATGDLVQADPGYARLIDYVIASTAIPIVMPVAMVGGQPLVDGGLRDVAPLAAAIDAGAKRIICVACHPERVGGETFDRGNLMQLADRVMEIATNEIVNNDIAWAKYINLHCPTDGSPLTDGPLAGCRYIPTSVIRPRHALAIRLEKFDSGDIMEMIDLGRRAAVAALTEVEFS